MSREPEKQILNGESGNDSVNPVADSDRLIEYARVYFAQDFPTPVRADCPPEDDLSGIIHSGELPGAKLRAHLFGCSECFRCYQNLKDLSRRAAFVPQPSWFDRAVAVFKPRQLAISISLLVCIGAIAGLLMWRSSVSDTGSRSARKTPVPAASSIPVRTESPTKSPTAPGLVPEVSPAQPGQREIVQRAGESPKRPSREIVASNIVRIDLREQAQLRDGDGAKRGKAARFLSARSRFFVTLPENSPKGIYKVSMLDAYGHELISTKAVSRTGKTLTAELDMHALPANQYRLCISLPEEAPDCYPFTLMRR